MKAYLLLAVLSLSLGVSLVACKGPAPTAEDKAEVDCSQSEEHPVARSIADRYGISYEQVKAWACGGETFEDILLALETSKMTGRSVEELLAMKNKVGWDKAWETLGLVPQ